MARAPIRSRQWPKPKTPGQEAYWSAMEANTVTFGVGPAGSGKTYLAAAAASRAIELARVERLIFCRPAVESEERLGHLPGDVGAKLAPYLRPLYDCLEEVLGPKCIEEMQARKQLEVGALAFMRGRTFKRAFVVLDEAQNTTPRQMQMFLTRIGEGSTAVVIGDPDQSDIRGENGLSHAVELLHGIEGVTICQLREVDIQRHPVVARIARAYAAARNL